jgi:hypothetical protein
MVDEMQCGGACCETVVGVWSGVDEGKRETVAVLGHNVGYKRRCIGCSLGGDGQQSQRVGGSDAACIVGGEDIETDLDCIELSCEIGSVRQLRRAIRCWKRRDVHR